MYLYIYMYIVYIYMYACINLENIAVLYILVAWSVVEYVYDIYSNQGFVVLFPIKLI